MVGQGGSNTVGVSSDDDPGATPPFAVRAYARAGGQRRLIIAAVIGFVAMNAGSTWLFGVAGKCGIVHVASQLAGSSDRFSWLTQGCTVPVTVQHFLIPDFLLMFGYWLMLTAILIGGWWRFEAPGLRRASWVLWLPTAVAVVDIAEYFLLVRLFYKDGNGVFQIHGDGGVLNWAQVTVSWTKWVGVAAMIVASVMAAGVWFSRRRDPFPPVQPAPPRFHQSATHSPAHAGNGRHGTESVSGICLGGSGIRSAAFCLGALGQLETASAERGESPTRSARYLAGVSGGAWAAAAWTLQKANRPGEAAADAVIRTLRADVPGTGYPRRNYLMNGRGGALGAAGWLLAAIVTPLMLSGLSIYLVAWPLGWIATNCVVDSGRLGPEPCGSASPAPADLLYAPAVVYAVLGVLWLIVCGVMRSRAVRTWPVGASLLALSAFSALMLTVVPDVFARAGGRGWAAAGATVIGAAVFVSVATGFWRLFGGPLMGRSPGRAVTRVRAGLLLLAAVTWAVTVMYVVATTDPNPVTFVAPAAVLLAMYALLGPNWPTVHNLCSARLRRRFDPLPRLVRPDDADMTPGTWPWISTKTHVPELILCCSWQRSRHSADAFTISPRHVRQGTMWSSGTADYLAMTGEITRYPFGPRDCGELEYASAWLATTGAGVRADAGVWLPNVAFGSDARLFPRPRFAYTVKRMLGRYGPDDRFVFVTDGSGSDPLGLLELLRRGCQVIYCVDATTERPGSFGALRETLRRAAMELDATFCEAELQRCLDHLSGGADSPAETAATTFTLTTSTAVTVHYSRLQVSRSMDDALKRRAVADPAFPHYSGPFLDAVQFESLVELGRVAGADMLRSAGVVPRGRNGAAPTQPVDAVST